MSYEVSEFTTKDGVIHTLHKIKTALETYTLVDKKRVGEYRQYDVNGQIRIRAHYTDDQLHGQYLEYNEQGKIIVRKQYFCGAELLEVEV
jgi:antitoxin component YwqK of YwqJK toxin-antitoxin module